MKFSSIVERIRSRDLPRSAEDYPFLGMDLAPGLLYVKKYAWKSKGVAQLEPQVGVIMGSTSDWETMQKACVVLDELGVPFEKNIVSAHRTPDYMFEYAAEARGRGIKVIIAGAGGAAHLPGMVAAKTTLPVIGVPVQSKALSGWDSLLSIAQMPGGVPVATVAIGTSGATNAGLLAAQMISAFDEKLADKLQQRREKMREQVMQSGDELWGE